MALYTIHSQRWSRTWREEVCFGFPYPASVEAIWDPFANRVIFERERVDATQSPQKTDQQIGFPFPLPCRIQGNRRKAEGKRIRKLLITQKSSQNTPTDLPYGNKTQIRPIATYVRFSPGYHRSHDPKVMTPVVDRKNQVISGSQEEHRNNFWFTKPKLFPDH